MTGLMASAPDLETEIMASWTAPLTMAVSPSPSTCTKYVRDDGDDVPDAADWPETNQSVTNEATDIANGFTDDASTMAEIVDAEPVVTSCITSGSRR